MPARRQRSSLRLAVADDAGNDQIGIVEGCSVGVRDGVAELTTVVDRTRRFRRNVAGDAAGKRELFEQTLHPDFVGRDVRIDLAVGSFEVSIRDEAWIAMPRTGESRSCFLITRFRWT